MVRNTGSEQLRSRVRIATLFAVAAMVAAWLTILVSALLNPWFRVTANALSDLGGGNLVLNGHPAPTDPLVYNVGLMVTGVLIAVFCSLCVNVAENRLEIVGLSFFTISALFLALIGIYHEGTYPHDFVSIWFFILSSISYATIGVSLIPRSGRLGVTLLVLLALSWLIYAAVKWQSVAEGEIFGIAVIDAATAIYLIALNSVSMKEGPGRMKSRWRLAERSSTG
ncbi:MAG: DUF998 domain-containing protein [Thermoprotei archaeon]